MMIDATELHATCACSFGAILAELLTGYPLFPGEDETEQLACIMEVGDGLGMWGA